MTRSVPPPSTPGHHRRVLTPDLGRKAIVFYAPQPDHHGHRQASLRIDDHPLVVIRVLPRKLIHAHDWPQLKSAAVKLGVQLKRLVDAIRHHDPAS